METLRRWSLRPTQPYTLPLAADARLRSTDYFDDQVWELSPGLPDAPALALQTQYGGRVGLATLIPLWTIDQRLIYETQAYASAPVIAGFAPGYLRIEATLVPQLLFRGEYWAIDSHTVGGRLMLRNKRSSTLQLRLDLFAHVGAEGKEQPVHLLPLGKGEYGLTMGPIGSIRPVVLLENAGTEDSDSPIQSPKIGCDIEIAANGVAELRWVHCGLGSQRESLAVAQQWLDTDWHVPLRKLYDAAGAIPQIETGRRRPRPDDCQCLPAVGLGLHPADQQPALRFAGRAAQPGHRIRQSRQARRPDLAGSAADVKLSGGAGHGLH